jgi:hypothetical protein
MREPSDSPEEQEDCHEARARRAGSRGDTVMPCFQFESSFLVMEECGWFISPDDVFGEPDDNGRVLLMQLSTQDGSGFAGTMLVAGFSNGVSFQETVSFNTQVPAPGALAPLLATFLIGPERRRRRFR